MTNDPTQKDGGTRRIVALCTTKNEEDLIEPSIRHNINFCDVLVVQDLASSDATRQIISHLMREHGNIVLADYWDLRTLGSQRMTRLLRSCQEIYRADYVFLLDADEFIEAPDRPSLEAALSTIPPGGYGLLQWRTYVLAPQDWPACTEDPPRSIKWCRTVETPPFYKAILRLDGVSCDDLVVTPGNHFVVSSAGARLPSVTLDGINLGHFPVRSRNQLLAKCVVGWAHATIQYPHIRRGKVAFQWKENFDSVVQGTFPSGEALCANSLRYAQEYQTIDWNKDITPARPPSDYVRIYSTGEYPDPLRLIAREWEQSIIAERGRPQFEEFELNKPPAVIDGSASTEVAWYWNNVYVDVPPFRWISEKHNPQSVLQIGCGIGDILALFRHFGAHEVYGIDHLPQAVTVLDKLEYGQITAVNAAQLGRAYDFYDFVICTEVAEHVDKTWQLRQPEVAAACATTRIIFSAPSPGQPGFTGEKYLPIGEWLRRWRDVGWIPDLMDTLGMRTLATLAWFRSNLIVLKPGGRSDGEKAIHELEALARRQSGWPEHTPGIRYGAFREPS